MAFVISVDGALIFVGDRRGTSLAESDLQCRMRICAHVEDLPLGCWVRVLLDSLAQVKVHARHGVDSLFFFVSQFHCLSWRRVGVGCAIRISPAVTRLTVYRHPQVLEIPHTNFLDSRI